MIDAEINVLNLVDHTLLAPCATELEINKLCEEAIFCNTFSVCVAPSYVSYCKNRLHRYKQKICTVVGFPNGYNTTKAKLYESADALDSGADEIDMVINFGFVKNKQLDKVLDEISSIKRICEKNIVKVIVEMFYLTQDEKIELCKVVEASGADFIKTSTGFAPGGATINDIELIKKHMGKNLKIKAAGGINNFSEASNFVELGVSRLGSSKLAKEFFKRNN